MEIKEPVDIQTFNKLFQVPAPMRQYIQLVINPTEMALIVAMAGETLGSQEIATRMGWPLSETESFLIRAYKRHVVAKVIGEKSVNYVFDYVDEKEVSDEIRYSPAKFYDRLDPITTQENWADIPEAVRKEISQWWLDGYLEKVTPIIKKIQEDPDAYFQIKQKDFLLLEEALEQVEAAGFHAVMNCDCRSSEMACSHMREGCIRFDDGARYTIDRGLGRVLTKEECKEVVINTDRDGLMHIGTKSQPGDSLFGFCNCCTCCCFPLRASKELGSDKIYPRSYFLAARDMDRCIHCGICVKRCPFQAFYRDGSTVEIKGKKLKEVFFDADKCYGCGLCSNACPTEAILMQPLSFRQEKQTKNAEQ